jgi:exosortase
VDEGEVMNPRRWVAACLAIGLVLLYWDLSRRLALLWWHYEYAGHGMFVPILSLAAAIRERHQLRDASNDGHWSGLVPLLLGIGVLRLGAHLENVVVEALSVPIVIAGLVMLTAGTTALRHAAFPIGFLVLMAPVPQPVIDSVTLHVQIFAASVAGAALNVFGIPFFRDGVMIELAGVTLHVAEACNGLRFLLGLFAITLAYAHITQHSAWQKAALAGAAIPIAVLANAFRVAGIATAAHLYGAGAVHGAPHLVIGKVVWIVTIAGLMVLGLLLRRVGRRMPAPVTAEA